MPFNKSGVQANAKVMLTAFGPALAALFMVLAKHSHLIVLLIIRCPPHRLNPSISDPSEMI